MMKKDHFEQKFGLSSPLKNYLNKTYLEKVSQKTE